MAKNKRAKKRGKMNKDSIRACPVFLVFSGLIKIIHVSFFPMLFINLRILHTTCVWRFSLQSIGDLCEFSSDGIAKNFYNSQRCNGNDGNKDNVFHHAL